jgi:hypothetical protein
MTPYFLSFFWMGDGPQFKELRWHSGIELKQVP